MTAGPVAGARPAYDNGPATIAHPRRWPVYDQPTVARAAALIGAGRTFDYHHGTEIRALEEAFATAHGGRHALALNSGTSALLAAYHALGLGPGDEVLVPTLTFLATASPLFLLGAVPVLCDAGPDGLVTAEALRARITPRTRAIVVTHLFGQACAMDEITALAREHHLPVVEDCSHAHGATGAGVPVGTQGDLAVYSIGGLKMVSGGMGGILLARDRRHYDLACLLSAFQQRSAATVADPALRRLADVGLGANLRLTPLAAVLAHSHFAQLDALVAAKAHNASTLLDTLTAHLGVTALRQACDSMGGWYDVVLAVDPHAAGFTRDDLVTALAGEGVQAAVPRTGPLHLTSVFRGEHPHGWSRYPGAVQRRHFTYQRADLPHAAALHDTWVSLPGPYLNLPDEPFLRRYRAACERALDRLSDRGRD